MRVILQRVSQGSVSVDAQIVGAIENGFVSITPLRLDLTDHDQLDRARAAHPVEKIVFA